MYKKFKKNISDFIWDERKINWNPFLSEFRTDIDWIKYSFKADTMFKYWWWYLLAFLCISFFPIWWVYWMCFKFCKVCIRYAFIFVDILIYDLIKLYYINYIYEYIRLVAWFLLYELWFIRIPKIVKELLTLYFWVWLVVKFFEKSILFWGNLIYNICMWIYNLINYRIPMVYKAYRRWYRLNRIYYSEKIWDFRLAFIKKWIYFRYNICQIRRRKLMEWRFNRHLRKYARRIWWIDIKMKYVMKKHQVICSYRKYRYSLYIFWLDVKLIFKIFWIYYTNIISWIKITIFTILYFIWRFLYKVCLLIYLKIFKRK